MINTVQGAFVLFLVIGIPLWDRRETRLLKAKPTSANRIRSYQKTIAWLWAATLFLLLTTPTAQLLVPPGGSSLLDAVGGQSAFRSAGLGLLASLTAGLVLPVVLARTSTAARTRLLAQWGKISFFLPHSPLERGWFTAVCISAGICEEFIYRGFLIRYLLAGPFPVTPIIAVGVAAAIFALAHGYQGWFGVLTTGLLALILTMLFVLAQHLWLPMLVHLLLDLRILLIWPSDGETALATSP